MSSNLQKGQTVTWDWGQGTAEGEIREIHYSDVSRTIKGSDVVRHGTEDNPAIVIEQDDGTQVLKLASELNR